MSEQAQIEADIEDAIHNHLGSHVEYVEFDADTTDGDTVLTEVRISDIAARLGPALHAAGYRKIPDEPTGVHTAACWEAFVAASNELFPGAGVSAPDDRQLDMCRRYAAAVLDVLRGAS